MLRGSGPLGSLPRCSHLPRVSHPARNSTRTGMLHHSMRRLGTGTCSVTEGRAGAGMEVELCRRTAAETVEGVAKASANMMTVGYRSAGVFSNALRSARSIVSGIDRRMMEGGDTACIEWRAMIAWTFGPVNG